MAENQSDRVEPHELDEDPEQHLGKLMKDPWNDPDQLDWTASNDDDVVEDEVDPEEEENA